MDRQRVQFIDNIGQDWRASLPIQKRLVYIEQHFQLYSHRHMLLLPVHSHLSSLQIFPYGHASGTLPRFFRTYQSDDPTKLRRLSGMFLDDALVNAIHLAQLRTRP